MTEYPFGPVRALDLHPRYAELRRTEPVTKVVMPHGGEAWLLTGYPEIKQFLADPRFSSTDATDPGTPRVTPLPLRRGGLLSMDPPDHTRIRRVVARAFTMRAAERLRPQIEAVAGEQFEVMARKGPPVDAVEHLAIPIPVRMICELFDIPYQDRHRFRAYSDSLVATTAYTKEEVDKARDDLEGYIAELVEQRRARPPGDELLGTLVEAMDTERLSVLEAARTGIGILMAGHETSLSMISNVLFLLLSRPHLWERLRADPGLVPSAIEEMLRVIPLRSVGSFPRKAVQDVRLGGVLIRAGETVVFQRASADQDERIFQDPGRIDLARTPNPHLGFGHGAHHCLGAPLARMELKVALDGLLARFPQLRLAVPPEQVRWKPGLIARCPERLLVAW